MQGPFLDLELQNLSGHIGPCTMSHVNTVCWGIVPGCLASVTRDCFCCLSQRGEKQVLYSAGESFAVEQQLKRGSFLAI